MAKTILIVDDEVFLLRYIETVLKKHHYKVFSASDGATAIELYKQHHDQISLVLLDLTMPGMSGSATFQALRKLNPNLEISFMSGYTEQELQRLLPSQQAPHFLPKPFCSQTLIHHLRSLDS